jgi:hypothetical protein
VNERDDDALVRAFLRTLAAADTDGALPDPQVILRRARLQERLAAEQRAADRVARPILAAGLVGPFGVAVVLAMLPASSNLIVLGTAGLCTALAAGLGVHLALIEE